MTRPVFSSPVTPGTGWPGDPATGTTPVAYDAAAVASLASTAGSLTELTARQSVCRACPRLVEWREDVALTKRRSFITEPYWGRPIPGWGDDDPAVVILGLAPAANGGNRTGRVFTGDRSGDWLFAALHEVGLATRPTSVHAADGQRLVRTRMVAAVRCAPPANKPTPVERDTCAPWLDVELSMLPSVRVLLALGSFAFDAALAAVRRAGHTVPVPRPRFGHGAQVEIAPATDRSSGLLVLGCFHPSQQNTFTGKLTMPMLVDVLATAKERAGLS
jgi:uracil-DNA glycosylase family 4